MIRKLILFVKLFILGLYGFDIRDILTISRLAGAYKSSKEICMEKLTRTEALNLMTKISQSNHEKKPYVRVDEREEWIKEIEDCPYTLYSFVKVYSKTWSRRICKLVDAGGKYYNLREARNILTA